jgi:hypothetical protein
MAQRLSVASYRHHPGHHCETNAARNVFAHAGLNLSEEMLFGLGEGLGFIYWAMKCMPYPVIGYRNGTAGDVLEKACPRLGIGCRAVETKSEAKAYDGLRTMLAAGRPACIFLDMGFLPYLRLPEGAHFGGHAVTVYEVDEAAGTARLSDVLDEPQAVSLEDLRRARGSIYRPFPPKNRLMDFTLPDALPDLGPVALDAIRANAEFVGHPPISNLGLRGFAKFARELRKWPSTMGPGQLLGALVNAFTYIEIGGTGGSGFRPMYARFLREAQALTGERRLLEAAELCDRSGEAISALGVALLPEEAPALGRIRRLLIEKDHLSKRGKGAGRFARMDAIEREMAEAVAQALAGEAAEFAGHVDAAVAAIEAVAEAESAANAALLG